MIKNVVFDMGNVLLDYNPNVILDKVCDTREEKEIIMKELFNGPEWIMGDRGDITNEERYELVKKRLPEGLHEKLKECVLHWDICMEPVKGAKEFLKEVKEMGYDTYIISNAATNFYEYFPKMFSLEDFLGIVVSADVHILKPDAGIYNYFLEKYHLKAEECLFIDDLIKNVEGAKFVGMQAFVFENNFDSVKKKYLTPLNS